MKHRNVACSVALFGWLASSCGSPNPIAPPLPMTQVPVAGLAIGGMPEVAIIGQSLQLNATVTLSDGVTKAVQTTDVMWKSDSADVATVSAGGVASLVGRGETNIAAEFQGARAIAHVIVGSGGVVHESAPTEDVILSNVSIRGVGGRVNGYEVASDAQGRFAIPPLSDGAYLSLTKDGYEEARLSVDSVNGAPITVTLRPALSMVEQEFAGTVRLNNSPSDFMTSAFPVYHDGEWSLVSYKKGAFWGEGYWLIERVSTNGNVLWSAQFPDPNGRPVRVAGGFQYRIRRFIGETTILGESWRLVWKRPR